jgi:hypothetical protein
LTRKNFKLAAADIKPLKLGLGGCIASDRITVEGFPVRFMYREQPTRPDDSGWNFFSGINEDDEYMNNPDNFAVYDVNTIANYDPTILPFVDSPVGSVFERLEDRWLPVKDWSPLN